mgnify:CR=1 FL=1
MKKILQRNIILLAIVAILVLCYVGGRGNVPLKRSKKTTFQQIKKDGFTANPRTNL